MKKIEKNKTKKDLEKIKNRKKSKNRKIMKSKILDFWAI